MPDDLETAPLAGNCRALEQPGLRLDFAQDPTKARGSSSGAFAGAAATLQLRLLECYLALPDFAAFGPQHEALTKLCSRSLRAASTAATTGLYSTFKPGGLTPLLVMSQLDGCRRRALTSHVGCKSGVRKGGSLIP